jgi:DNA-binding transcriptional LysR family regulator
MPACPADRAALGAEAPPLTLAAVFPSRQNRAPKVRVLVDFVAEQLAR